MILKQINKPSGSTCIEKKAKPLFEPEGRVWDERTSPLRDCSFTGRGRYYYLNYFKLRPLIHPLIGDALHSNSPRAINRVDIAKKLNDKREFRNRIYHYEAICF